MSSDKKGGNGTTEHIPDSYFDPIPSGSRGVLRDMCGLEDPYYCDGDCNCCNVWGADVLIREITERYNNRPKGGQQ